jgi:hypothetical protein
MADLREKIARALYETAPLCTDCEPMTWEQICHEDEDWIADEIVRERRRDADAILSLIRAEDGWMPIESAPKDGSAILIWQPREARRFFEGFDDQRYAIGYWRTDGRESWGNRNCVEVNPSHWIPLPAPPKEPPHD